MTDVGKWAIKHFEERYHKNLLMIKCLKYNFEPNK